MRMGGFVGVYMPLASLPIYPKDTTPALNQRKV